MTMDAKLAKPAKPDKNEPFALSARDKTPAPSVWGYYFEHTVPQRRVPCVRGNMLAPLSADSIPPITPEAMASVQAALKLLADLVGDRDHNLFLAHIDQEKARQEARSIMLVAKGIAGILRVEQPEDCCDR